MKKKFFLTKLKMICLFHQKEQNELKIIQYVQT